MKEKKICFLIDDDEDDQEIFRLALQEVDQTIHCESAFNGVEALERLAGDDFMPDFIFLDVNMPRMSGSQCLSAIKKLKHLDHIPVYMYSTSSDKMMIERSIEQGASGYIIKPSSISDLTVILCQHLLQRSTGS